MEYNSHRKDFSSVPSSESSLFSTIPFPVLAVKIYIDMAHRGRGKVRQARQGSTGMEADISAGLNVYRREQMIGSAWDFREEAAE